MTSGRRPMIDWRGRRIIAVPVVLLLIIMGLTAYLGLHARDAFVESRSLVIHSHDVIEAAQTLLSEVQDAEASRRGYLLTGNPAYLAPYRRADSAIPGAVRRLRGLVGDNGAQTARVERLVRTVDAKRSDLAASLALARDGHAGADRAALASNLGEVSMEQVRLGVADLIAQEKRLLDQRSERYETIRNRMVWVVLLAAVAAMAGLIFALQAMIRGTRLLERRMEERDTAEAARLQSDALYGAMFANAADYLFVIDTPPDGRFILADVNPAVEAALGRSAQSLRGRELGETAPPDTAVLIQRHCREMMKNRAVVTYEDPIQTVAGPRVWETTLAPVLDGGRVVRIVGCARDISERARAEEQIRKAQRMEAVGQLTGGVAHDFNNLLQVIRANLEMLAPKLADDEASSQRLKSALRGADRAAQLTRQLLAFARRQPLEPKVVNLGRLLGEMSDLLARSMGEAIVIDARVDPELWNALVDAAQVENAILNLALNARDAMPDGGRFAIELSNVDLGAADAAELEDLPAGQYVRLTLSDTGLGMSPEVLSRVFEPFFTTKGEEKGTGLGLSMVYGFVKQSHGHIHITSEAGRGATVRIYLPRTQRSEERANETPPTEPGRSDTVLVAEDDAGVRAAACAMLQDLGYRCLQAEDAQSALRLLEDGADVQLLFTDVVMPGPMTGADLAARARELDPNLPILFTSGYTRSVIGEHERLGGEVLLLSKPYGQDELAQKIQAAMRAVRPTVLVVEDEPLVRLSAIDMVEDLGFIALSAEAGGEALDILRGPSRVDVLFTDVGLPDMKGPDLAQAAMALRPGLKVLFASGYAADGSAPKGSVWLSKPYEKRELSQALDGLLASERRAARSASP